LCVFLVTACASDSQVKNFEITKSDTTKSKTQHGSTKLTPLSSSELENILAGNSFKSKSGYFYIEYYKNGELIIRTLSGEVQVSHYYKIEDGKVCSASSRSKLSTAKCVRFGKYKDGYVSLTESGLKNPESSGFIQDHVLTENTAQNIAQQQKKPISNAYISTTNGACYTVKKTEKYEGDCRNGKAHGHGHATSTKGTKFSGKYLNGRMFGQGVAIWTNGDKYVGDFRNDIRTGKGVYTYANGDKYVGEFQNNNLTGQGVYTWANGTKYDGRYQNGNRTGQGVYTWVNGNKYVGEFQNNKRTGQGVYTWANGDKYVGEFRDNEEHGHGVFTSANGDKYVGEFQYGSQTGNGEHTSKNTISTVSDKNNAFRCQCDYKNWIKQCDASIELGSKLFEMRSNTNQCSRVDWRLDGNPHMTIVTDGVEVDSWFSQSNNPQAVIESCNVCTDSDYPADSLVSASSTKYSKYYGRLFCTGNGQYFVTFNESVVTHATEFLEQQNFNIDELDRYQIIPEDETEPYRYCESIYG